MDEATFYFDLGSPYAYLSGERIGRVLRRPVSWQPILLGGLFKVNGRSSWGRGPLRDEGIAAIERRAADYGLPPLRWPDPWPGDMLTAMRAATHAHAAGKGVEFGLSAFRLAFVEGVDLSAREAVLEAGRRAGLATGALDAAIDDPQTKAALRAATDVAHARGVFGVPTVAVGDRLVWGDDRLDEAA